MAQIQANQETAQEMIESSMRLIGALAQGRSAATRELSAGIVALNAMLESWNLQKPLVYQIAREAFPLSSQNPHTIGIAFAGGSNGDFAVARPPKIQSASVISGTIERDVEILSDAKWQRIPNKGTSSNYPNRLWYERAWPLGKIWLYPEPSGSTSLVLNLWKQLASGLLLADHFSVPPGYLRAIRFNLAVEIASEWGQRPPEYVVRISKESKASIASVNRNKPSPMRSDVITVLIGSRGGHYDIESGEYY